MTSVSAYVVGIAVVLHIGRTKACWQARYGEEKVIESIDALLDNGFIQFARDVDIF